MKVTNDSMSVRRSFGRMNDRQGWTDGEVVTPNGIVSVYAQGDEEHSHHTRLDFALDGRLYMRHVRGKRYSHRGLVTLASRFAAEISQAA